MVKEAGSGTGEGVTLTVVIRPKKAGEPLVCPNGDVLNFLSDEVRVRGEGWVAQGPTGAE
jgi:hypothetical protein